MSSERWQQIEEIFQAVLDCEPGQSPRSSTRPAARTAGYCVGEVDSLLQSDKSVAEIYTLHFRTNL